MVKYFLTYKHNLENFTKKTEWGMPYEGHIYHNCWLLLQKSNTFITKAMENMTDVL